MARYLAFIVVGCAFTLGAVAMVQTHLQSPNASLQVVASHSAR